MCRPLTPEEFAFNEAERINNLRDEFALSLANKVFEETFSNRKLYADSVYKLADALVKQSEKYRNAKKGVNKDD